jgi:hypothetical protein
MPILPFDWEKFTTKVVQLFSKQEVKTPLSFFFRMAFYELLLCIAVLFSPGNDGFKIWVFKWGSIILIVFWLMVYVFALCKPKNLVYGEAGHRAERKLTFGTDTREIDRRELERLPGSENPKQLGPGGEEQ